ncbi:glycosyltransferase family 4 protein [Sulfurimonas sp.]|uniref:glycosyltransferase n=1 Tax=Sulfurimonas sp. TaxID=2022749 RepID=UPI0025D69B72|nr:glycosyltransferase family 4 protein [Sulfurimonas sp.]
MKNLLYVDREFENSMGGDKNRSRYLHKSLQNTSKVFTCIINDSNTHTKHSCDLELYTAKKTNHLLPQAIAEFSQESLNMFVTFIKEHEIKELFIRTIAFSSLAVFAKRAVASLNIIIDADLILSRLMQQAWQKKRSLKNRYYLFESVKLFFYEKALYKNNFTILFSNEDECFKIKEKHVSAKIEYLPNTTDIKPKEVSDADAKVILFFGVMDSTANIDAYKYIETELYERIKDELELYDYEIHVVGKNCEALNGSTHKRIKIIGKVDSIESAILKSSFVLLPIFIASGTNTRVIECAIAGRALVTTPLGMEGLTRLKDQEYIAQNLQDMSACIKKLMCEKTYRIELAKDLQEEILATFSYENFQKKLEDIINNSSKSKVALMHVPRRFTQSSWGGTETVVISSTNALKPLGYDSSIYTSKALDKTPQESIGSVVVKRFDYFYPFFGLNKKHIDAFDAIGGNLFSFSLLFALLRKKDIDLIHLHTLKRMGSIVRSVAKYRKIPYVITLHGGYFNINQIEVKHRKEQLKNGFEWGKILGLLFGSRKVLDDATAIITLSKEEYVQAHKRYGEKVHYISNGVDIDKFRKSENTSFKDSYNIPASKKMILCSARIDTQKNQLLLLEVFKELSHKYDDLHLVLLGAVSDNDYFILLKSFIKEHSLNSTITFVENLTPKDQLLVDAYREAEILVLPSRHEPFGMVILESWAASTPVVASLTGGIGKIITHNKNGLLFKNGDKNELYENITYLLDKKDLKDMLVENASKDVKKYDWKHIAKDLDFIYKSVLKSK